MNKLKQESTWRGLIAVVTACGVTIDPDMQNSIIAIGISLIGIINIFKKD